MTFKECLAFVALETNDASKVFILSSRRGFVVIVYRFLSLLLTCCCTTGVMFCIFVILQLLFGGKVLFAQLTPIFVVALQVRHVLLVPQKEFVAPCAHIWSSLPKS